MSNTLPTTLVTALPNGSPASGDKVLALKDDGTLELVATADVLAPLQAAVQALAPGFTIALPSAGTYSATATHARSSLYLAPGSASVTVAKNGGAAVALSTSGAAFPVAVGDVLTFVTTGAAAVLGN